MKQSDRANAIRRFEKRAITESQSQIFIEAPYRNVKLIADFLSVLSGTTRLTIAADILSKNQYIRTLSVAEWRQTKLPELNKRPAIFIVGGNRNH